jgi:hypothetical protein
MKPAKCSNDALNMFRDVKLRDNMIRDGTYDRSIRFQCIDKGRSNY